MRWGHFAEVVVALLYIVVKKHLKIATKLVIFVVNILCYLGPVLLLCYFSTSTGSANHQYHKHFCYFDTPYSEWMYIEVFLFICWSFSTAIFLLLSYTCKYRSAWRLLK